MSLPYLCLVLACVAVAFAIEHRLLLSRLDKETTARREAEVRAAAAEAKLARSDESEGILAIPAAGAALARGSGPSLRADFTEEPTSPERSPSMAELTAEAWSRLVNPEDR